MRTNSHLYETFPANRPASKAPEHFQSACSSKSTGSIQRPNKNQIREGVSHDSTQRPYQTEDQLTSPSANRRAGPNQPQTPIPHPSRRERRPNNRHRIWHYHRTPHPTNSPHNIERDEVIAETITERPHHPPCSTEQKHARMSIDGSQPA